MAISFPVVLFPSSISVAHLKLMNKLPTLVNSLHYCACCFLCHNTQCHRWTASEELHCLRSLLGSPAHFVAGSYGTPCSLPSYTNCQTAPKADALLIGLAPSPRKGFTFLYSGNFRSVAWDQLLLGAS